MNYVGEFLLQRFVLDEVWKINFQYLATLSQRIFAVYRNLTASCFIGDSASQNVLRDR